MYLFIIDFQSINQFITLKAAQSLK